MHRLRWIAVFGPAALIAAGAVRGADRELMPATPAEGAAAESANPDKAKNSHANYFLIHGTVFSDKAMSFPQVEVQIRRSGEKKYRWHTLTNSRGDFAVRVPSGGQYEVMVHAKGFADQHVPVDAKAPSGEQNTVFRMVPAAGGGK
ncbi:MAG: hypothetical protein NVS9B4_14190 [Candidatus Acidiferrum sp.]